MLYKLLATAMLVGACGTVTEMPADAAVGAVTWKNQPGDVPAMMFGGGDYCMYKITLKQLDVQLAILPSGQVTSGHVQDLNVEEVVPSSPPTTPFTCTPTSPPPIPANIAMYQLATAAPSAGGMTLTFQGGMNNMPPATLVIDLTKVGSLYSAGLTFHRNDPVDPVLLWMVTPTVPLAPQ